jgi:ABC-type spermidine/putrescine transport system permease subunit I
VVYYETRRTLTWNWLYTTSAILYAIRCQGYHYTVDITYPLQNHQVTVKSNSRISELMDSNWIRVLLVVSCLWIVVVPAYYIMRRKYGHKDLKSEWTMKISEEEWYRLHVHEILGQVHRRF